MYNSQGVIAFIYQGETYTYRKNMFGDIIAIYSGATKLVEYAYDAWGNCTIVSDTGNIGLGNPFRYRGYYWDDDLKLYYLMSRYYDPQVGRFINADSLEYLDPETIGGLNLYAYCGNNPVMGIDPLGTSSSFWNYIKYELGQWWTNTVRQINEILQDIQATVDSLMNNFVFDLGLGVGIGLSTKGKVSVGAGAWMDFFHISISKEWENGVAVGMRGYVGGGITFFDLFEFGGTKVDEFRKYGSKEFINSPDNYSSFVGISSSSYFLIGGSISIGFNLDDLLYDLKEIWR